jgi:Na+-translocating ferredoxin:NAD+ oxidoreductase RnfE subunit
MSRPSFVQLIGGCLLVAGCFLVTAWLGLVVAGVLVMVTAEAMESTP